MRIIHISDLHLGKQLHGRRLIDDQEYILGQILDIIDTTGAGAVIMAGDIYDKTVPSAEAVKLLDDFFNALAKRRVNVVICAGNHDSVERLSFGERIFSGFGIHISPIYDGNIKYVDLDGTRVHILPFIKPANVRAVFDDREEEIKTYTDALRIAIENMELLEAGKNILCAHQFVTGAVPTESEEISVGGIDNVDASVFEPFDYVALGHIHRAQNIGEKIRYCGTPLKYSFSEENDEKSVTVIDTDDGIRIETIPLRPMREMRTVKGTYEELTYRPSYENTDTDAYIRVVLTDEYDVPDAMAKLRVIYPNILLLEYDNERTRNSTVLERNEKGERLSPMDYLNDFYSWMNGREMNEEQRRIVMDAMENIWGKEDI